MKTYAVKAGEIRRRWLVVDAAGKTLGRLAVEVAGLLSGKTKPMFSRHLDTGDFVVVVNAGKVRFTGKKEEDKTFFTHTMHPGGAKQTPMNKLRQRHPEQLLENAVRRMLPRTALGRQMLTKLKVYAGDTHPHAAQKPEALSLPQH